MENRNLLKGLHAALAVIALVVFLAAPFVSFGGKYEMSGADLLDRMGDESVWIILFIITPLLAALSNLSDSKAFRGIASLTMLLPVLILLGKQDAHLEFAAGGIIYCLIAVGLAVLAFAATSGERAEQEKSPEQRPYSDPAAEPNAQELEVREYDAEKLNEIVSNAALYKPALVEQCSRELEIRNRAGELLPQVKTMQDDELREKLASPELYSDELIYACGVELEERRLAAREQREREEELARLEREKAAEELRIKREKEEAEARLRRAALWKRWRPYVYAAILLAAGAAVTAYMLSDTYRYKRGVKFADKGLAEKAVGRLSLISNPKFENYSAAKYLLYKQQLQLKDSASAAAALTAAVAAKDWKAPRAYEEYTDLRMSGSLAPHIPRSELRAAEIYRTSPEESHCIKAGKIYFDRSYYNDAHEIFSAYAGNPTAKGYLGMMYLFGLGNQSRDVDKAWEYLEEAPNTLPFVVYKGDLTLMLRKGRGSYSIYPCIEKAREFYAIAARMAPDNKDYAVRHEVTRQVVAAKEKHDNISYWDRGRIYWHTYTFDNGAYEGEFIGSDLGGGSAQGWGYFTWKDHDEFRIARFSNGLCNGPGLDVTRERITVGTLKGNYGALVEGSYCWSDGDVWTGTWKDSKLVKGKKYDLHGHVTETVK